jgi:hypothetical protein
MQLFIASPVIYVCVCILVNVAHRFGPFVFLSPIKAYSIHIEPHLTYPCLWLGLGFWQSILFEYKSLINFKFQHKRPTSKPTRFLNVSFSLFFGEVKSCDLPKEFPKSYLSRCPAAHCLIKQKFSLIVLCNWSDYPTTPVE